MKTLRLCLLILLAVLLPVRGAVAAAMLCPAMGSAPPMAAQMVSEMGGPGHDHARMLREAQGASGAAHDDAAQCKLCCAFCSLTPMPSGLPTLAAPQDFTAATFPEPLSPAPSFVSGGQERPPRST